MRLQYKKVSSNVSGAQCGESQETIFIDSFDKCGQGLIERLKAAKGHVTYEDGEIL